jgi:hypothetical protein
VIRLPGNKRGRKGKSNTERRKKRYVSEEEGWTFSSLRLPAALSVPKPTFGSKSNIHRQVDTKTKIEILDNSP